MKLLKLSLLALALLSLTTSCSKDEEFSQEQEVNFSIDVNLANQTDWQMANEIMILVNEHRMNQGLSILQTDQQYASAYAVDHTFYMIDMDNINHDNFAERKQGLKDRGALLVGENVAFGYRTAEEVVNAWLNSEGHRKNIEGSYTHSGFGVIQNSKGHYYFTQLFYRK